MFVGMNEKPLNPLKGTFRVCAFDNCAKAKSPLGDLGVIKVDNHKNK
jgi:hypothetical protein